MTRFLALLASLYCILSTAHAIDHRQFVPASSWEQIAPHLMPDTHPAKNTLDKIIGNSPVFYDMQTMTQAGFDHAEPQRTTRLIVTRHPKLKGYVIKAYLDTQEYYGNRPEYYYWAKRAEGANLIREAIKKHNYSHLLKTPRKWIYALPSTQHMPLPAGCKRKLFILVEDDMDILDDAASEKRWSSPHATKELLSALHTIITEFRFRDCAKPANCPFSKDGRVALIDTQSFYKKKVGYKKLNRVLTTEMKEYWEALSAEAVTNRD